MFRIKALATPHKGHQICVTLIDDIMCISGGYIYNLYLVHYEGVDPETGMALYTGVKTDDNGQPVKDETGNYTYESTTNWNNAFN